MQESIELFSCTRTYPESESCTRSAGRKELGRGDKKDRTGSPDVSRSVAACPPPWNTALDLCAEIQCFKFVVEVCAEICAGTLH